MFNEPIEDESKYVTEESVYQVLNSFFSEKEEQITREVIARFMLEWNLEHKL